MCVGYEPGQTWWHHHITINFFTAVNGSLNSKTFFLSLHLMANCVIPPITSLGLTKSHTVFNRTRIIRRLWTASGFTSLSSHPTNAIDMTVGKNVLIRCRRWPWRHGVRTKEHYTSVAVTSTPVRVPTQLPLVPNLGRELSPFPRTLSVLSLEQT